MRLITWNCKGGFDRKHAEIAAWQPDVLVLPEAGRLGDLPQLLGAVPVNSVHWIGSNPNKGLGVISYGDYSMTVDPVYDSSIEWIVPLRVAGPRSFTLIAVWTVPDKETRYYITQLLKARERYDALLRSGPVVVAGDFNQNFRLDRPNAPTFKSLVEEFEGLGVKSTYHTQRQCDHGQEPEHTFFMHHHPDKPQHLDYIFASGELVREGLEVTVGRHEEWLRLSDHMPVGCRFGGSEQ